MLSRILLKRYNDFKIVYMRTHSRRGLLRSKFAL